MTILLLTNMEDPYSPDLVRDRIQREGAEAIRVETDLFPAALRLSTRRDGTSTSGVLTTPDRVIPLDEVTAAR